MLESKFPICKTLLIAAGKTAISLEVCSIKGVNEIVKINPEILKTNI